jgi:hypothetical protein
MTAVQQINRRNLIAPPKEMIPRGIEHWSGPRIGSPARIIANRVGTFVVLEQRTFSGVAGHRRELL